MSLIPRSAHLAWQPNGEGDLAGYRVHYGTLPGIYSQIVDVVLTSTPGAPSYTVLGQSSGFATAPPWPVSGKWYFVVTAYNTSNMEGAQSNEVSKAIPLEVLQAARM